MQAKTGTPLPAKCKFYRSINLKLSIFKARQSGKTAGCGARDIEKKNLENIF